MNEFSKSQDINPGAQMGKFDASSQDEMPTNLCDALENLRRHANELNEVRRLAHQIAITVLGKPDNPEKDNHVKENPVGQALHDQINDIAMELSRNKRQTVECLYAICEELFGHSDL